MQYSPTYKCTHYIYIHNSIRPYKNTHTYSISIDLLINRLINTFNIVIFRYRRPCSTRNPSTESGSLHNSGIVVVVFPL